MNRFWSILFFLVPILAVGTYVMAASNTWPFEGAWMPASYSSAGDTIDELFNGLHLVSAAILIGTGLMIGWILWRFGQNRDKSLYIDSNTKLEITWSVIPGIILVTIAFCQMHSWEENKLDRPTIEVNGQSIPKPPLVLVRAKQFGWEFYYAGADGKIRTEDDVFIENLLVVPVGEEVVLQLESDDVIHSFFVPELRLKQDIVPGMRQFAWFQANKTGDMQVICAELCGWGHYKMKADMRVVSRAEFDNWLDSLAQQYGLHSVVSQ